MVAEKRLSERRRDWTVYIVETQAGKLYTGITVDVGRRLGEHAESVRGAKFFRLSPPRGVRFLERHPDRAAASRREAEIKRMSRTQKLRLIAGQGTEEVGSIEREGD